MAESAEALLPGSIQSLVLARMDRLDAPDKRAAQAASVRGQHFGLAALRHLIGDAAYDCAGLLRHQLVRPEGDDILFTHALIREGVYGSILTAARKRLHLEATAWFGDRDRVLRAEHLGMADDPGAAELEAAQAQLRKYRYEQAVALLQKGKALAREPADRVALTLAIGEAQHDLAPWRRRGPHSRRRSKPRRTMPGVAAPGSVSPRSSASPRIWTARSPISTWRRRPPACPASRPSRRGRTTCAATFCSAD